MVEKNFDQKEQRIKQTKTKTTTTTKNGEQRMEFNFGEGEFMIWESSSHSETGDKPLPCTR